MINWGDWQNMPDYREGWVDKNKSGVAGMLRSIDPLSYIPGVNKVADFVHKGEDYVLTGANRVLAPALKFENETLGQADPIRQTLNQAAPEASNRYQDWWVNHGGDIAAIAAATYFSGGLAGKEAITGAAAAQPAASGAAGSAGGLSGFGTAAGNAITPAFASGAAGGAGSAGTAGSVSGSLAGASAITPAFASGTYGGIAGAAGTGTLGQAGSIAASKAVTPYLSSIGAGTPPLSTFETLKSYGNAVNKADKYRSNISKIYQPGNEKQREFDQANALANKIVNDNPTDLNDKIKKMSAQIVMNQFNKRVF